MVQPYRDHRETPPGFRYRAPAVVLFLTVSLILWIVSSGLGERGYLSLRLILNARQPSLQGFLTSHLFHQSGVHLLVTILVMLTAAGILETRWGTLRFVAFYLFTAWGTALVTLLTAVLWTERETDQLSCGAAGVALGSLVAVGVHYPEHRIVRLLPPARHLAWILVFLGGAGLVLLPRLTAPEHFYLPQVSGVALALAFVALDPWLMKLLRRWRARREAGRKEKVTAIRLRVDELLEKISTSGYESLTRDEKLFLRQASKHYRTE